MQPLAGVTLPSGRPWHVDGHGRSRASQHQELVPTALAAAELQESKPTDVPNGKPADKPTEKPADESMDGDVRSNGPSEVLHSAYYQPYHHVQQVSCIANGNTCA